MKLVLTGGGTGGHTLTAISVYNIVKDYFGDDLSVIYIGSYDGIEKELAGKYGINYFAISTGKLRRYFSFSNFVDIFRLLKGIYSSFLILRKSAPNLVFSTGGFVSVPVVISARLLGIPIIVHEQTVSVGLANRLGGYFADKVAISFSSSARYFTSPQLVHTGQPIREELFNGTIASCYKRFGFTDRDSSGNLLPIVYVTGGSQGSHKINLLLKESLNLLLEHCNIVHQCGRTSSHNDFADLQVYAKGLRYESRYFVRDFFSVDELSDIFASCLFLLGRSGAGTVHEAIAFNIPSLFIPLSIAMGNEQYYNAKVVVKAGGGEIIAESSLSLELFQSKMLAFLRNKDKLDLMRSSLSVISNTSANSKILDIIIGFLPTKSCSETTLD